jgi:hypothetical protein
MRSDLGDLRRRHGAGLAWALALALVASGSGQALAAGCADALAGQSVTWIVPNAPGGGYDTFSRLIAPFYGRALGAAMRIENRAGAGGTVGAIAIKEAAPDGTAIGILNGPGLLLAVLSGDTQTPNPATDFTILARVARSQHVWVTGAASGLKSIDDVFALAETRPVLFVVRCWRGRVRRCRHDHRSSPPRPQDHRGLRRQPGCQPGGHPRRHRSDRVQLRLDRRPA